MKNDPSSKEATSISALSDPDSAGDVVRALNDAWQAGRIDDLALLFHEHAVIVDGSHEVLAEGRTACAESYRAFITSATIESYREGLQEVRVFGPTALVTYPFEIAYRTDGASHREAGSDALVLAWEGGWWQIVWRQLIWYATS